jgi:3-hydroxyisobutyrate dehydrogenase-like beta-hydroxyacid dehydrogenase
MSKTSDILLRRIALIGFGEAGSILGGDLAAGGCEVTTYDILLDAPATRAALQEKAQRVKVRALDTLDAAVAGADLVISAVTATAAAAVAVNAGRVLRPGQILLDINSVSPATKRANAQAIQATGADYVEAAVMAAVPPQRLKVPMLLGGPRAAALAPALSDLGMNTTALADEVGVASAVKMCRSILIKGLEALTLECLSAARRFGAEEEVLRSLQGTFPAMGWQGNLPDYLVSRVAEHGRRRAAEMREVALTLKEIGIEPTMALAIAARQDGLVDAMSTAALAYPKDRPFSWRALLDALNGNGGSC